MKKYVVERSFPGTGNLSPEELQTVTKTFCDSLDDLDEPRYWIQSFITDNKIYSIHIAENVDHIKKDALLDHFPVSTISEVKTIVERQSQRANK
jgi:hypothetical protein